MANVSKEIAGQHIKVAVFTIGNLEFALDIMQIKEIIKPIKITVIPKAPRFIEGVINLRGGIIPIVDLRKRFGVKAAGAESAKERVIVTRLSRKVIGLIVDSVTDVISLDKKNISPPPEIVKGISSQFIKGVGKLDDRLILLIDLDTILTVAERISLKESL